MLFALFAIHAIVLTSLSRFASKAARVRAKDLLHDPAFRLSTLMLRQTERRYHKWRDM